MSEVHPRHSPYFLMLPKLYKQVKKRLEGMTNEDLIACT